MIVSRLKRLNNKDPVQSTSRLHFFTVGISLNAAKEEEGQSIQPSSYMSVCDMSRYD